MRQKAQKLLEHGLKDMYDAEQRFVMALGPMIENSHDEGLTKGLRRHRAQTEEQVRRLEKVFDRIGSRPEREECPAARGLVREYEKFVEQEGSADGLHDAFAATASLKVEHYEIASYRALIDLAEFCDYDDAANLLKKTLAEEEMAAADMQSAATALSAELAGASVSKVAARTAEAMIDQIREGTVHAIGGTRTVGQRAVKGVRKAVRTAERRGRKVKAAKSRPARRTSSGARRKPATAARSRPRSTPRKAKSTAKRGATTARKARSTPRKARSTAKRRATTARRRSGSRAR